MDAELLLAFGTVQFPIVALAIFGHCIFAAEALLGWAGAVRFGSTFGSA